MQANDMETTTNNWKTPGASDPGRYIAAPGQLDEERRTGVAAAVHTAASYRASRVCDRVSHFCGRDSHASGRAMQAATEAGCAESDESMASASASAAIIKEK